MNIYTYYGYLVISWRVCVGFTKVLSSILTQWWLDYTNSCQETQSLWILSCYTLGDFIPRFHYVLELQGHEKYWNEEGSHPPTRATVKVQRYVYDWNGLFIEAVF